VTWQNLGNPYPLPVPVPYVPVEWREGSELLFHADRSPAEHLSSVTSSAASIAFDSLIASRRTRYSFGPLSLAMLGALFALTSKVTSQSSGRLGFPLSHRPAPSGGAIHPIHVITHLYGSPTLHRYDPFAHSLRELHCDANVGELRESMNSVLDGGKGALLLFVAEPGRTFAKYAQASSLVWRDAGILQGYFSVAAEALGINFAPLGITGEPWAGHLVQKPGLAGVGAAFAGARH
jgi:hypothetical protein